MKKYIKQILAFVTTLSVALTMISTMMVVAPAGAQTVPECAESDPFCLAEGRDDLGLSGDDELNIATLRTKVVDIIRILLSFLGLVAVVIILYAGALWMTAAGNDDKVTKAKATLSAGLIGLIIIIVAYTLTATVVGVLNDILTPST